MFSTESADRVDNRQWALWFVAEKTPMTISLINSISAGGLAQNVLSSSNSNQLRQTLQTLQNNLASGNLTSAQSAFQRLQTLFQNSATANGNGLSSSSQLSTDMVVLGTALSSGDVSGSQSAFATVLGDLKLTALPSQINETTAAAQSVQLVQGILSSLNSNGSSSSSANLTNSIPQSIYTSQGGLDVYA
jgi:hypothetical protein